MPVQGGERARLADAERVERPGCLVLACGVVELVHEQEDGRLHALEHARHALVFLRHAHGPIHDEEDDGRLLAGGERLVANGTREDVLGLEWLDAAGVHDGERAAVPVGLMVAAVARDSAALVHDGVLRLGQAVDEGRLAHVGASDDRDDGFHVLQGSLQSLIHQRSMPRVRSSESRRSPGIVGATSMLAPRPSSSRRRAS